MSDLSRLRARLGRIEKRGKALKAELAELQSLRLDSTEQLTRWEEKRLLKLEAEIAEAHKAWAVVWAQLRVEERRYLNNPTMPLRFT